MSSEINAPLTKPSIYYSSGNGIFPGTEGDFKNITGATWVNEMVMTQEVTSKTFTPTLSEWELSRFIKPLFNAFRKRPPPLYIRQGKSNGFHTLHAMESIDKGTVIAEYLGEWQPDSILPSQYRWGPIEGSFYRNFGGMIDDGFPNVGAFHLYGIEEVPLRVIFISLDPICPNEILTVNYGMQHSIKLNMHLEHRQKSMFDFFSKTPLREIFKKIRGQIPCKRSELGWKKSLEFESLVAKLQYLYQTPSALIHLFINDVLKPSEVFGEYDKVDNKLYLLGFLLNQGARQKAIMDSLEIIRAYFCGDRLCDSLVEDLLNQVQITILINIFLKGVLLGEDPKLKYKEALLTTETCRG